MIDVIKSASRGSADHGWLKARHSFSFADYYDPERVHFGPLRVINEDRIAPGGGFPTHPHRDMEIITYPISGAIEHRDSMGNGTVIKAGEVQRMTAGTGVRHSEYNPSDSDELHLLQIWILPEEDGLEPGYEQTPFSRDDKRNQLRLIASRNGHEGSVTIHQDAAIFASVLEAGYSLQHALEAGRKAYVQVISGTLDINGESLKSGDGLRITDEAHVKIAASSESELLLFDLG